MILQSFPIGTIASLSMRIINSVVVVGLYYGFLTTFSIGPSYLLLFYAHIKVIQEGEKEIYKEVAAATGLITGQLVMFISIYYTPLHLALGRPHTITFLVLSYLLLLFYWYNYEDFDGKRKHKPIRKYLMHNPSIQSIYLISLIYQLLNHFFFPSSMLARLVNIYMFRYNNKMLFVTSSFVGWLIGHILFMKLVKFVLVWIQQQNSIVRANRYILSNKYLFHVFGFYRDFIFDLRKYMNRFCAILVFFICLCTFGRMPSPFLTYKINPEIQEEKRKKTSEEKEKKEKKEVKEKKEEKEEKDPSTSLYISKLHRLLERSKTLKIGNKDISKLDILQDSKNIPTSLSFPGNKDISKLDIVQVKEHNKPLPPVKRDKRKFGVEPSKIPVFRKNIENYGSDSVQSDSVQSDSVQSDSVEAVAVPPMISIERVRELWRTPLFYKAIMNSENSDSESIEVSSEHSMSSKAKKKKKPRIKPGKIKKIERFENYSFGHFASFDDFSFENVTKS